MVLPFPTGKRKNWNSMDSGVLDKEHSLTKMATDRQRYQLLSQFILYFTARVLLDREKDLSLVLSQETRWLIMKYGGRIVKQRPIHEQAKTRVWRILKICLF